ncbi:transcriptional regulator, GntR family protein (plasmid) [Arthrobacter sp. Hiyo8]|nr:transcriptional regulator, GntR family protein [Arthrobacter sp. Hiyo8]
MKTNRVLQPIVQESTPSLIAAQLRKHIAEGTLAPGAQLVEADIARELGVSRGRYVRRSSGSPRRASS